MRPGKPGNEEKGLRGKTGPKKQGVLQYRVEVGDSGRAAWEAQSWASRRV